MKVDKHPLLTLVRSRMPKAVKRLLLLCCLMMSALLSTRVYAHAFPVKSSPRVGAVVHTAPEAVTMWFDMDLEDVFSKITVKNAAGTVVSKDDSRVLKSDPSRLHVDLKAIGPGTYTVHWSVIARDGHHTEGHFRFTVK